MFTVLPGIPRKLTAAMVIATIMLLAHPAVGNGRRELKIVSAASVVSVRVDMLNEPEQWHAPNLEEANGSTVRGGLIQFAGERHFWFKSTSDNPVDVIYIDANRQVAGILERMADNGVHGICKPVLAVMFLPAGFVATHRIVQGNLIVADTFALQLQTQTPDTQKRVQRRAMISKLARAAKRNLRTADELGKCYLEHRMFAEARTLYHRMAINNDTSDVQVGLALAMAGEGKVDDARQILLSVITNDSTNVDAYRHLARLFREFQNLDAVVATFAKGLTQHPELTALRLELATLYVQNGAPDRAISLILNAPAQSPEDNASLLRVKGDAYLRQGRMADAADAYRDYLEAYPYAPHGAELRLFIARHRQTASESDVSK